MSPTIKNRFSRIVGILVALTGLAVMLGWIVDLPLIITAFQGYVSMKFTTALALTLSGTAILLLFSGNGSVRFIGKALSLLVAFIGILVILEHLFHWESGIGLLFWKNQYTVSGEAPGRMSAATAVNCLIAGTCLFLLFKRQWQQVIQILAFVMIGIALMALVTNDFSKNYRTNLPFFSTMTLHTASAFALLGSAILFAPWIRSSHFPFEWKLIGSIGFILFVMISAFYLFNKTTSELINSAERIDHTRKVLLETEKIQGLSRDIESGTRGFIISGNETFLSGMSQLEDSIHHRLLALRQLTADNPSQLNRIDSLDLTITDHIQFEKKLIAERRNTNGLRARDLIATTEGLQLMNRIRWLTESIKNTENNLLEQRQETNSGNIDNFVQAIFLFLLLVTLMLVIIYLLVQSNLHGRSLAEQELKESEEWFATTLSSIGDGVMVTDENGKIIFTNPIARNLTRWGAEAYGRDIESVFEIVHEKTREKVENPIRQVLRDIQIVGLANHTVLIRKDKTEILIDDSAAPIINDEGRVTGVVLVFRDVTAQKQKETQIRYNSKLLENITDAIISTDKDFCIVSMNREAEILFQCSLAEVKGRNIETAFQAEYPNHNRSLAETEFLTEGRWRGEMVMHGVQGRRMDIHTSAACLYDEDGQFTGVVSAHKDITQRLLAERRNRYFAVLYQHISDAIISVDTNFNVVSWNKSAEETYGYTEAEVLGKPLRNILHSQLTDEDRNTVLEKLHLSDFYRDEYEYKDRAGNSVFILSSVNVIRDNEGTITGYVSLHRNITERRRLEDQLRNFNRQLEEQVQQKTSEIKEVFSRVNDGFMAFDADWNFTYLNARAGQIFKLDPATMLGKNVWKTLPRAVNNPFFKACFRAMESQEYVFIEDYSEIYSYWYESHIYPSPKGISVYFRDVSERKRAEAVILKEKVFSENIVDSLPGIFYFFDQTGKFLRWNRQFEVISEYSAAEIAGMHPTDFFADSEKDYISSRIMEVFTLGKSDAEANFKTKNGKLIPFYFTGAFLEYEGQPCLLGTGIDITERRKTEAKLQEERVLLRTLIDHLPDYIYVKDAALRHLINNKAQVALLGAGSEAETIGKTSQEYALGSLDESLENDRRILETGSAMVSQEEFIRTATGEQRWLLTTKVPVKNAEGKLAMLVSISRDITARKLAEKELEASNERFEMIARTTNDAIWESDLISGQHWANPTHQRLYGLEPDDPIPTEEDWENRIHPGDRLRIVADLKAALQSNAQSWIAEYRFLDGEQNYISIYDRTYIDRNEKGEATRMLGSMMDISDRKKAEEKLRQNEEKYRLLFSNSPLPLWVFDLKTFQFLDVNEAALRHYGYSREEFLSMTILDIRPQEEIGRMIKQAQTIQSGVRHSGIWKHLKKNGTLIDAEINSHDITYNGRQARLVLANDVTDRIKTEQLILETSEQLRQLSVRLQEIREEERMHMAHEIHDELGQRLTVLKMDVSWINRKIQPENTVVKEKIKSTLELLDGTIRIVRKIATDLRPGILDDLGLIPALEWQSKEFEERAGIKVTFQSNMSEIALPATVTTGLFRIFQESLTNIGRHAAASFVEASLIRKSNVIVLTISDNGIGFDTTQLGSKKTLGLMGMKERTLGIGGEYTITSTPGKGCTVIVSIPYSTN